MNKTLKSIVMTLIICVLGYTQIGCQADNIKNENPQVVKDYNNQDKVKEKNNQNNNESKDNNDNLTSKVENLSSNAEIHFIDTGNSDAILIIKDNKAALIDGGDNDDEALVSSYIKKQGISELEYVFATHPHADHIGGLDKVAKDIKINNLYVSNGDSDTKTYRDFINASASKGLYPSVPLLGSKFDLSGSTFEVISVANTDDPNNNSIVLLYTNGNDKILLMGDAEKEIEQKLNVGDVDLLKVGHHGSHSSSSKPFINKVNPEYAVILVGENNKYGHPHKETMETLKEKGIEVHRSDECKDIIFTSTGNGLQVDCKEGSYNIGANSKYNKTENIVKTESNTSSVQNEGMGSDNNQNESISIENNKSDVVYWTKSGKKYHSDPNCSGMKSPISGTIKESQRTSCSKCY
nr:ComEC/Rec2 family competence protein [uncultured Romboutsia sp.]